MDEALDRCGKFASREKTGKEKSLKDPQAVQLLSQWHRSLERRSQVEEGRGVVAGPWDRGLLKRCRRLEDVMMTPVFYSRLAELRSRGIEVRAEMEPERLAMILGVLVWVKSDAPGGSFSRELGRRRLGSNQGRIHGHRFQRLLRCQSPDGLYRELRDAVRLLGSPLPIGDLIRDLARWEPGNVCPVRYRWAEDYYQLLPEES